MSTVLPPAGADRRWFDPSAALLALLLAIAAALPLATSTAVTRSFYFFDVTLTSDAPGSTRFSWDLGHGFNESDSSVQPLRIERKPVVYRFLVPPGTFRRFRLVPVDRPGRLTLAHARLIDARGHLMREFGPGDFRPNTQASVRSGPAGTVECVASEGPADPTLDLPLAAPLELPVRYWMLARPILVAGSVFVLGLLLGSPRLLALAGRRLGNPLRRLTRHPRTVVLLAAAFAVALQAHPVIFFGRSFASPNNGSLMLYSEQPTLPGARQAQFADTMGSDVGALLFQHLYYPMVERDALLGHGELPLWNRYTLAGEPLLGQGQSMLGDPLNLLTILANGRGWAWDIRFVLAHWLLAAGLGLGAWMLTRHLPSAVLVALASAYLGLFTFRINHPATFSVCYAPWILVAWLGLRGTTRGRGEAGWLALLLLANWTEYCSGTVKEASALLICLNGAGLLLLLVRAGRSPVLRPLLLATATGGIFLLLAAPLWISFFETLSHSVTAYSAPRVETLPAAQIVGLFDDLFYRQKSPEEWVVAPALNAFFLLGVIAWAVAPRPWKDRDGLALLGAALPPAALAFGLVPAGLVLRVPGLNNIWHVGDTFSCPLLVLLPLLAARGFQAACASVRRPGWWRRLAVGLTLLAALAVAFLLGTRGQPKSPFFEGYAAALGLALLALPLGLRRAAGSGHAGALCVVLVLGLPSLLWRHGQYLHSSFNRYVFVPGERADFFAPSPAVALAQRAQPAAPSRVIGLMNTLFPVYNVALRWESLYGVDALRNRYYLELTSAFGMSRVQDWAAGTPIGDAPRLQRAHDLLNVATYLADHRSPAREISGLRLVGQADLAVYSSPTAWPRAFYTDRAAIYADAADFASLLPASDGRPFAAIQTGETRVPEVPRDLPGRRVAPATDYRLTANTTAFSVDAPAPGLAVLTEAYYADDFQATLDGRAVPYFRVNHAFKGIALPAAGRHRVVFTYRPEHFDLGLRLAGLGALLAAAGGARLSFGGRKKCSIPAPASA